ncbi:MAG: DUF3343 domain-containing protein, partial [Clostridia bacterium]|nr:DUF3343 domain-containing protein [Clostridia bacterium]
FYTGEENFMTDLLAVFRSRAQAADCNSRLRMNGVPSNLVNTPKEANIGCGLSVKIPQNMAARAKALVLSGRYSAFYGFYTVKTVYGKTFFGRD